MTCIVLPDSYHRALARLVSELNIASDVADLAVPILSIGAKRFARGRNDAAEQLSRVALLIAESYYTHANGTPVRSKTLVLDAREEQLRRRMLNCYRARIRRIREEVEAPAESARCSCTSKASRLQVPSLSGALEIVCGACGAVVDRTDSVEPSAQVLGTSELGTSFEEIRRVSKAIGLRHLDEGQLRRVTRPSHGARRSGIAH